MLLGVYEGLNVSQDVWRLKYLKYKKLKYFLSYKAKMLLWVNEVVDTASGGV